jgi:hypothetical protein
MAFTKGNTRCSIYAREYHIVVTARLLPRRFCFDASDELFVFYKAVEEVGLFLG